MELSLYFDILIFVGLTSHGQCESAVLLADARWILGLAREPAAEAVVERKKGSRPLFSSLFAGFAFNFRKKIHNFSFWDSGSRDISHIDREPKRPFQGYTR